HLRILDVPEQLEREVLFPQASKVGVVLDQAALQFGSNSGQRDQSVCPSAEVPGRICFHDLIPDAVGAAASGPLLLDLGQSREWQQLFELLPKPIREPLWEGLRGL